MYPSFVDCRVFGGLQLVWGKEKRRIMIIIIIIIIIEPENIGTPKTPMAEACA